MTIGIVDYYGQIVKSSSNYVCTLQGLSGTQLKGQTFVNSVNGLFVFDDFIVISPPGANA